MTEKRLQLQQQNHHAHCKRYGDEQLRPTEHFLTIALNGTIIGATEMMTGFPPGSLLMTSTFDSVYEDDLLGMHAVKTHFWERDQPDVEVYIRRRTIEGEWIWIMAKVVSYIDSPVRGMILHEQLVENETTALMVSRLTRVASLLLQAVESSLLEIEYRTGDSIHLGIGDETDKIITGHTTTEDLEVQQLLIDAADELGVDLSEGDNFFRDLIQVASNGDSTGSIKTKNFMKCRSGNKLSHKRDVHSLEYFKTGAVLDLSKILLSDKDIQLVALVLTGQLKIEDIGPVLYLALNAPKVDIITAINAYSKIKEQQLKSYSFPQPTSDLLPFTPPPLSVINLSFTNIGDLGMEVLSKFIYSGSINLKSLDFSFCNLSTHGLLCLCQSLKLRSQRGLSSLQVLSLSGNTIKKEVAIELGSALSSGYSRLEKKRSRDGRRLSEESKEKLSELETPLKKFSACTGTSLGEEGIKILQLGSSSLTSEALAELLSGLGSLSPLEELTIQSNQIGSLGVSVMETFFSVKSDILNSVLPKLIRLDLSYNKLDDTGIATLARVISKRSKINMTKVSLSGNRIGPNGIENLMNRLIQHKLITLNLDNNFIGDQGCQLVAASLPSMSTLSNLNLSFNNIGCRGIATLMRSLLGCESITSLGLSGNTIKLFGAIAMGYTLAHHPRLSTIEVDNCCLSQVAQCHIVAGIISNRWVIMKILHGFRVGPPMVAMGALEIMAQTLSNDECFRLRRDIQMKTILQWMESNRASSSLELNLTPNETLKWPFFTKECPPQSAYLRMLDWLGHIPFDEAELTDLVKYFYDSVNDIDAKSERDLKYRGDILAALSSKMIEEILESEPFPASTDDSVGLDLSLSEDEVDLSVDADPMHINGNHDYRISTKIKCEKDVADSEIEIHDKSDKFSDVLNRRSSQTHGSVSTLSISVGISGSHFSNETHSTTKSVTQSKARITMFPQFASKLDELKAVAQEMMDRELDEAKQNFIAKQFAEASLTILRQLRYHCMESGLDGWRQGKIKRKVLIIDDSIVTRKLVAKAFEKVNFVVDTAENGVEGVIKMKESIYDIAFMDIDMPVMNGFDATKALRVWEDSVRPGARQPICALTAACINDFDRSELMKFKDSGLNVMESKPCNIPRLFKVVDDLSPMFSDLTISSIQLS